MKQAYFAGGCFWGMEQLFGRVEGVKNTEVGYMGGETDKPSYKDVTTGKTGHAEVLKVEYNPQQITYRELVKYFFRIHDPTTLNRQKNDVGTQYRSAIFTTDEKEVAEIKDIISKLDKNKVFKDKVVTRIENKMNYFAAEEYHQEYLRKNPNGYQCHLLGPALPFE